MSTSKWTQDDVQALLEREDFKYQDIELPYGLSTGGRNRSATVRAIFPNDMTGKTVLDVGCKYGYFCFEALKRGASHVVGVDFDPESIRKAQLLADCLGVNASFNLMDIESDSIDKEFDYVLCLNLLHHLKNPIGALDKLIAATRERLVLEVAALGAHDVRKLQGFGPLRMLVRPLPLLPPLLARIPAMVLSGHSKVPGAQKFFLSSRSIEQLLQGQRRMFARIRTYPSEHKNRFISVADKWQIDKLVVIAGPTSSGKSTLIARFMKGEEQAMALHLGLNDPTQWQASHPNGLSDLQGPHVRNLIFHYDILRPYLRGPYLHKRDEALDILDTAKEVIFVTLLCSPEVLVERLIRGEIEPRAKRGTRKGQKRYRQIESDYRDFQKVHEHYARWFEFVASRSGEHILISNEGQARVVTLDEWQSCFDQDPTVPSVAV